MTDTNPTEHQSDCLASVDITVSDDDNDIYFEFGNVDPSQNGIEGDIPSKAIYFDRCKSFVQRHIRTIRDNSDVISKEVLKLHGLLNDHHYLGKYNDNKLSISSYSPMISYIGNPKNPCSNHASLKEHPNGIKPGDKFDSYKAFMDYVNDNAKQWFFYYTCSSSKRDKLSPNEDDYFVFSCIYFGRYQTTSYKSKGIRNKKSRKAGCPCEVKLKHIRGTGNELVVTFVCNHHTHPLTKESFNSLPHLTRMPIELLEEILQFMSMGINKMVIRKYIKMKTSLEVSYKALGNLASRKTASAPKEPELLLEKIHNLELLYGNEVWANLKRNQPSGAPKRKRVRNRSKKQNISVTHTLDSGPGIQLETSDHEETNEECKNVSNGDKERIEASSLKRRAKRTSLSELGRKRSRLKDTLQKSSQDEETSVSVQKLQEAENQNRQNEDKSHGPCASILKKIFNENKYSDETYDVEMNNLEIGAEECYSEYDHTFKETSVSETDTNENLQNNNVFDINNSVVETDYVLQIATDTNKDKVLLTDDYYDNTVRISKFNDKQNKFAKAKYSKMDEVVEVVKETKNCNDDLLDANSYDVIHIDKYNIDSYFQNSELLKHLGTLAKQMSMSVFSMLKTIYQGSARIEMGVPRASEDDNVYLSYSNNDTEIDIPSLSNTDEDSSMKPALELYKYKELIVKAKEELKQFTDQISVVKKELETLNAERFKLSSSNRQLTIKISMLREHLLRTLHEIANNFVNLQKNIKENIINIFCEKVSTIRSDVDGNVVKCATDSTTLKVIEKPKNYSFNNLEDRWCTMVNDFLNVICIALVKLVDSPSIEPEDESNNQHNNNDDGKSSVENENKRVNNITLNKHRHNQENTGSNSAVCKSTSLRILCSEVIITKQNIDCYLTRSKTMLSIEKLSKKLSMSLVSILASIYKGEAIIKIVKNGDDNNNINISYVKTKNNNVHSFNTLHIRIHNIIKIVRKKMANKLFDLRRSIIKLKNYETSLKKSIVLLEKRPLPFCCNRNLQIMWRYFKNIQSSIKKCLLRTKKKGKRYKTSFPVTTRQLESDLKNILDDINYTELNTFENITKEPIVPSFSLLQWKQMWHDNSEEVLTALKDFVHHILTPGNSRNMVVTYNTEIASNGNILNTCQRMNAGNTHRRDMTTSSNDKIDTNSFATCLSKEFNKVPLDSEKTIGNPNVQIDKDVAIEFLIIDNIGQLRINEKQLTETKDVEPNSNIIEEIVVTCHNLKQYVIQEHILSCMILLANKLSMYYNDLIKDIIQKKMAVKIVVMRNDEGKQFNKVWSIQGTACSELVSRNEESIKVYYIPVNKDVKKGNPEASK